MSFEGLTNVVSAHNSSKRWLLTECSACHKHQDGLQSQCHTLQGVSLPMYKYTWRSVFCVVSYIGKDILRCSWACFTLKYFSLGTKIDMVTENHCYMVFSLTQGSVVSRQVQLQVVGLFKLAGDRSAEALAMYELQQCQQVQSRLQCC